MVSVVINGLDVSIWLSGLGWWQTTILSIVVMGVGITFLLGTMEWFAIAVQTLRQVRVRGEVWLKQRRTVWK